MDRVKAHLVHGAFDYEELERLGLHAAAICDLSVNSNPYGPSPRVRQALAEVSIEAYPDRASLHLRRTIQNYELANEAGRENLPLDSILCGNGTAELIWGIARTFLHTGSKVAIIGPTFGEYSVASLAAGASIIEYRLQATEKFYLDRETVITWIEQEAPTLLWLCNPNNPTGTWLDAQTISALRHACQRTGTVLVIDEAYWRFLVPVEPFSAIELLHSQPDDPNVPASPLLILRSLTKDYALAGVRLGYVVATPEVIERVRYQLPSWNVSAFAQAAGISAIMDHPYLAKTLHDLALERRTFFATLDASGLDIIPSRTHFCLIKVGNACSIRQQLLAKNI